MNGADAPDEAYHYVNGGENLPRYHYQKNDYSPLFSDENTATVEEWYYGDIEPKKNICAACGISIANETTDNTPADTDELENNF